jgi:hypothetical protein
MPDTSTLFASMFWSSIGVGYIVFGRKQRSISALSGGIALNLLAYVCDSILMMSLGSLAIMVLVYILVKKEG